MEEDTSDMEEQHPAAAAGVGGGAAPREDGGGREESAIKLFIGQVTKFMTEAEQAAMFRDVAIVNEVTVIRDIATKISRYTTTRAAGFSFPPPHHPAPPVSYTSPRIGLLLSRSPHLSIAYVTAIVVATMNSQERSNRLENLRWRFWNVSMQKKHGGRKMLCCLQAFFKGRVLSIVISPGRRSTGRKIPS
ncbi:hypothetical protein QYE76_017622 [Lolium multiflorum]|uniref:Uncharacterized protein n=1 Tax=Lolium multiflorum TaxID=4521 RepID=A0AAD8QCR9_LOLMU|nr:hypothetical protein QYE76_017622 [Lolium multiflorum]